MKALVLYDSFFGNTEKIALSVAESLRANAEVQVIRVNEADPSSVSGIDLLVLGSPTRGFRPSEGMTAFLNKLTPGSLNGINAAAFDTRVDTAVINSKMLRFMAKTFGYADKVMVNELQKKGANLISIGQGFIVNGNEGPLKDGELERAAEWAKTLVG
jgi:flavodoxin